MTINYTLFPMKGCLSGERTSYLGQIVHNDVLDLDGMSREYAEKFHLTESAARYQLSCLGEYIADAIERGRKLNFHEFSVSLKMTGTFQRGNDQYDAKKNPIKVVMTPSKVLQKAASSLNPINATEKMTPRIDNIIHDTVKEGRVYTLDTIRLDGELTTMNAYYCKIDKTAPDEGVFLTSLEDNTPLLTAEVVENTMATCDVRFPKSDLPAGDYYILIATRGKKDFPLVTTRRKVKVVQ